MRDHTYVRNASVLSEFSSTVICYIAGFVVFSIQVQVKSEECYKALQGSSKSDNNDNMKTSLIDTKTRGALIYPSDDVLFICRRSERVIRAALYESGGKYLLRKFPDQYLSTKIMSELIGYNSLFSSPNDHNHDQSFLETHSVHLIKAIIQKYIKVRSNYICSQAVDKSALAL